MNDGGRPLLIISLWGGAAYDAVWGGTILLIPDAAAAWTRIPMPSDELYLRFLGVFLLGLAFIYSLPARDPERYRGVVVGAILLRAMGFLFLTGAVLGFDRPMIFLWLGAADGIFALLHAVGLRACGRAPGARRRAVA